MEQLKQRPIWICCKIAEVNGRKTKIPCAAKGGATGTSKEYAHTGVTYDEAVAAMKKHGHTGVASTAAANCLSFIVTHFRKRYIHSFTPKRGDSASNGASRNSFLYQKTDRCYTSRFMVLIITFEPVSSFLPDTLYIVQNGMLTDMSVLQEAPFTDKGSIVEVFDDLSVWMGI